MTHDDPSWHTYPDTVIEIAGPPLVRAPVCEILDGATQSAIAAVVGADAVRDGFAVITACNPFGQPQDAAVNAARTERLAILLSARGARHLRSDGVSRSDPSSHREEGFVVVVTLEAAIALAIEMQQSALFWFDGTQFTIVPAASAIPGMRAQSLVPPASLFPLL